MGKKNSQGDFKKRVKGKDKKKNTFKKRKHCFTQFNFYNVFSDVQGYC